MNAIVKFDAAANYAAAPQAERLAYTWELARAGALLPRTVTDRNPTFEEQAARVFYLAELGAMMGIHPLEALNGIHLIEGKPSVSSALMSAMVRKAGHKLRVEESGSWRNKDFVATCTIVRNDDPDFPTVMSFGYEDAEMAGLLGKDNWKKYGKSMCAARAISKCARAAAEDALGGARYTPEELGASTDADGEPVHYESTPERAAAAPPRESAPAAATAPRESAPPAPAPAPAPAAAVSDEDIIDSTPASAITHAKSAHGALANLDIDELGGVWASAQSAKALAAPAMTFDSMGRPAVYRRDEAGAPVPLGTMIKEFKAQIVEALAAAESASQDAAAEAPQVAYAEAGEEPVDAEEVAADGGGDDPAA